MISPIQTDLLIIGAGCAGLSLAAELSKLEAGGTTIPRVQLIEPREKYLTDRSWCFWAQETNKGQPIKSTHTWPQWEFGTASKRVVHSTDSMWRYHYQDSGDFYTKCLSKINKSERINLSLGERATSVIEEEASIHVITDNASYECKHLIDTRPPSAAALKQSTLLQIFYGVEIELKEDQADPNRNIAQVMVNMAHDHLGFKFHYVLPLANNRCLVELTRFTPALIDPVSMRDETLAIAQTLTSKAVLSVRRTEEGVIPMGLPSASQTGTERRISVGLGGGAARPSTGYAFQRIQAWARHAALKITLDNKLHPMAQDTALLRWMDSIFLQTLRKHPELGATLFSALAHKVPPGRLVRFLTDQPTLLDLAAIIWALPKAPLLHMSFADTMRRLNARPKRVSHHSKVKP